MEEDYFAWFFETFERTTYVFQQDNAPAHCARDMVELLCQETFIPPDLCPANSHDLKPVGYSIWGCVQQRVYTRSRWTMLANWSNVWLRSGLAYSRLLLMGWLMNGDAGPVSVQRDVILNICCNIDCSMSSADIFTLNAWMAKPVTTVVSCYSKC